MNTGIGPLGLFFGKVIGNTQTTGTFGHSTISKIIANIYSIDQRVQRVTMDLGYKTLLGKGNFKYGPKPDVGVLYKNGRVKIIEIASKTDKINDLISRNKNFMNIYNIDGDVRLNRLAQFMEKVKSKFKIKCK